MLGMGAVYQVRQPSSVRFMMNVTSFCKSEEERNEQ